VIYRIYNFLISNSIVISVSAYYPNDSKWAPIERIIVVRDAGTGGGGGGGGGGGEWQPPPLPFTKGRKGALSI
jgi:hypothetical protein